jgi:hypothetical protein
MSPTIHAPLNLDGSHLAILTDLVESERARLLVEIRHTHHRAFREELCRRLTLVEDLAQRCGIGSGAAPIEHEECA